MDNISKKRHWGLLGLYFLLLLISSMIQQFKYFGTRIFLPIIIIFIVLIGLWKYLLSHKIIKVTWTSMTYEPNTHKSERMFLFSLVTVVAPVLRFHDLTVYDVIISVIAILVGVIGFEMNERRLNKKAQSYN